MGQRNSEAQGFLACVTFGPLEGRAISGTGDCNHRLQLDKRRLAETRIANIVSKHRFLRNERCAEPAWPRCGSPFFVCVEQQPAFDAHSAGSVDLDDSIIAGIDVAQLAQLWRPLSLLRRKLALAPLLRLDRQHRYNPV